MLKRTNKTGISVSPPIQTPTLDLQLADRTRVLSTHDQEPEANTNSQIDDVLRSSFKLPFRFVPVGTDSVNALVSLVDRPPNAAG